ncbi:MAG: hypothetical protein RIT25_2250 [Planctomycetota bacterium]|jgi:hypothetical protein
MTRIAILLFLAAASCVSLRSEAAPPRTFDPTVGAAELQPMLDARVERVTQAEHLTAQFAVRTAEHEVVFDRENLWIATPRAMVEEVGRALLRGTGENPRPVQLHVGAFDLDLRTEPPAAVVVLDVTGAANFRVTERVDAAGRSADALAAAMGKALQGAMREVLQRLRA